MIRLFPGLLFLTSRAAYALMLTSRAAHALLLTSCALHALLLTSCAAHALLLTSCAVHALLLASHAAHALDVKMAVQTDASSIDPHYHVYSPNTAVYRHIFDTLTQLDARGKPRPCLALHWATISDEIWEFKLRRNVIFHDGTPFTAADVVFSIARAPSVPNSPSSHAQYTRLLARTEIVDPLTIRIHAKGPRGIAK